MKYLKLVNIAKFKEWLEDIEQGKYDEYFVYSLKYKFKEGKNISNLSNYLGLQYNTVKYWFKSDKPNPTSDSLLIIFNKFTNLRYEDLGVKKFEKEETHFQKRLAELMNEYSYTKGILAQELNVEDTVILHWLSGNNFPSNENLIKLAKIFNVSTEFLKGTTNQRQRYDFSEPIAQLIENNTPDTVVEIDGEKISVKDLEEQYPNLLNKLLNEKFINVFREEINRVIKWHTDKTFYNDFEGLLNERNLLNGGFVSYSQDCTAIDIAHSNINKILDSIFDNTYKEILIEKNYPKQYIGKPDQYHILHNKNIK